MENNNKFEELNAILEACADDFTKFYNSGNKAAGTRIRKHMQELKNKAQEVRLDVQKVKEGL